MITTRGAKYTLVLASLTKLALQSENMPPAMRLEFLGHLDKMVDRALTPAVIAMVEPMCGKGFQLVAEARKLGHFKALDVYADKFDLFAALNPSLRAACEEASRPWAQRSA
jgi:hypothetical protein